MKDTLIKEPESERKNDGEEDLEWQTGEETFTESKTQDEKTIATIKYTTKSM